MEPSGRTCRVECSSPSPASTTCLRLPSAVPVTRNPLPIERESTSVGRSASAMSKMTYSGSRADGTCGARSQRRVCGLSIVSVASRIWGASSTAVNFSPSPFRTHSATNGSSFHAPSTICTSVPRTFERRASTSATLRGSSRTTVVRQPHMSENAAPRKRSEKPLTFTSAFWPPRGKQG